MSIRTHSGNTARRPDASSPDSKLLSSWRGVFGSALIVLLLVSCSTGDARDERKFEAQEAKRTEQVPLAQQTALANTFFQPTGTPQATLTPNPLLSELVITTSLDASGGPATDLRTVPLGSQAVILAARLTDLSGDETITVQWLNQDGVVLASEDQQARSSNGPQWYTSAWQLAGVPGGTYAGAVRVNGQLLNSIVFTLGST